MPRSITSVYDKRRLVVVALLAAIVYLALATWVSGEYGPTWDCSAGDYAYGEATWHALLHGEDPVAGYTEGRVGTQRQPHPGFESDFVWVQMFPFAATLSAASCDIFWTGLGWLSPIAAHHFVISLLVASLLFAVVVFLGRRVGILTGILAAAFLVASPRFFAHAQNNLKDIPEACLYSLCALVFYRASSGRSVRMWCTVGVLAALALAQKQNALFLPVQFAITMALFMWMSPSGQTWREQVFLPGMALALAAFSATYWLVSPWIWFDMSRIPEHWHEFLVVGGIGSGSVSWDGPYQVLITTPIPLMILGLVGMFARKASPRLKIFLITWLAISLGRLLLPGMPNFDGVRHFLEFYPPLAMLAGLGAAQTWTWLELFGLPRVAVRVGTILCFLMPGALATASTHPNGICYFNAVVGGLRGATELHLPEAADYWGNSYWQGLTWLNDHAPTNAQVLAPISPQILRAGSHRLRKDLKQVNKGQVLRAPLCVIYTTHEGMYGPLIRDLESHRIPATQIDVQDTPILRIHVLEDSVEVAKIAQRWQRENRAQMAVSRIAAWAQLQFPSRAPEVMEVVNELPRIGLIESTRRLQSILPEDLHQDAADLLWWKEAVTPPSRKD